MESKSYVARKQPSQQLRLNLEVATAWFFPIRGNAHRYASNREEKSGKIAPRKAASKWRSLYVSNEAAE